MIGPCSAAKTTDFTLQGQARSGCYAFSSAQHSTKEDETSHSPLVRLRLATNEEPAPEHAFIVISLSLFTCGHFVQKYSCCLFALQVDYAEAGHSIDTTHSGHTPRYDFNRTCVCSRGCVLDLWKSQWSTVKHPVQQTERYTVAHRRHAECRHRVVSSRNIVVAQKLFGFNMPTLLAAST